MTYKLSSRQRAWLDKSSSDERIVFMAKGPAHVLNMEQLTLVFRPAVRGILLSDETLPTHEAALAAAEAKLAEFRELALVLPTLDEHALGIDDVYRSLGERMRDASVSVEWSIPLFCLHDADMLPDALKDALDLVSEADLVRLQPHLPRFVAACREAPDDDADERAWRDATTRERDALLDEVHWHGNDGVILHASQPTHIYLGDGGFEVSYGCQHLALFYGASFEAACEAAIAWGDAAIAASKTKPPPTRKKPMAAEHGAADA